MFKLKGMEIQIAAGCALKHSASLFQVWINCSSFCLFWQCLSYWQLAVALRGKPVLLYLVTSLTCLWKLHHPIEPYGSWERWSVVEQKCSEKVIAGTRPPVWSCRNPCVFFSSVSRAGSLASFIFSSEKGSPAVCFMGPFLSVLAFKGASSYWNAWRRVWMYGFFHFMFLCCPLEIIWFSHTVCTRKLGS